MTKQWVKSSNGPDWVDIRVMMKELMVLHKCAVYLEIMCGTMPNGPELRVVCTAVSNAPGSDLKACEESVAVSWPNASAKAFEGAVYGLLVALDNRLLALWWRQETYLLP